MIDIGAQPESAEIFVAYPKAQGLSAKLRALISHLKSAFGEPPYWDLDLAEPASDSEAVFSSSG